MAAGRIAGHYRLQIFRQPILWLTLLYLVFELGFSARLLDVSSGNISQQSLRDIERIGRTLSGIALALALLPLIMQSRHLSPAKKWLGASLLTAISIGFMFWFQAWLVERLTDSLDARERRNAVFLSFAAVALSNGEMRVARLDLGEGGIGSPSAKAFVAAFPALALTKPDLEGDARNIMRQLLLRRITESCSPESPNCFGSAAEFHDNVWLPLYARIVDGYALYTQGAQAYHAARREIPQRQEAAWQDQLAKLKGRAAALDRASSDRAVREQIEREADRAAQKIMQDSFGADMPLNLVRFEDFFRHPAIQRRVREVLRAPDNGMIFPAVALEEDVRMRVFEPLLAPLVEAQLAPFMAPEDEYDDDGLHADRGREAADRVIVPPIALAFSLLGGLGHLFKLGYLLLTLAFPLVPWRARWHSALPRAAVMGAVVAVLVYVPMHMPNDVVESPAFPVLHRYATERFSMAGADAIEWIIRAQAFAYPCNEAIRQHILLGLSFGYSPSTS